MKYCFMAVLAALVLQQPVAAQEVTPGPIAQHMQHILTGERQWRTPNPDYKAGEQTAREFGLRFRLAPDGNHVTGDLTGIYENGREVRYWTLYSFFNPVTQKVIAQQIGGDGTYLYGERDPGKGKREILDMLLYGADGKMKIIRHDTLFVDADTQESDVYERDAQGGWKLMRQWVWRMHDAPLAEDNPPARNRRPAFIEKYAGHFLTGSGEWRAPNPDFKRGGPEPEQFGINYKWGPYKQHVIAEIISIYEGGRVEKDWSLYFIANPVTEKAYIFQTGKSGVYFQGEMGTDENGRHTQTGLIYIPNGTVISVRDETDSIDDNTHVSHVFERDETGGWKKVREWTWRQLSENSERSF